MQTIKQLFKAGIPTLVPVRGSTFLIQSTDQGNNLEVDFMQRGAFAYRVMNVGAGFKARPQHGFDGLTITAPVDTNVQFIVTDGDIDLQITSQNVMVTNGNGSPVPVNILGATITAGNVIIGNDNPGAVPVKKQALSTLVDIAPVTAGLAAVTLSNDATMRGLRVRNGHATATIGLGGAGVTMANAAVQLTPGQTFFDDDAAGAHWYVISDTAATNVQVSGVK